MVGTSPPPGLCSFSTQRRCSVDVKTITELRISATKLDHRGWMSENYPSLRPRGKCFLLTSPFIELLNCETDTPGGARAIATALAPWLGSAIGLLAGRKTSASGKGRRIRGKVAPSLFSVVLPEANVMGWKQTHPTKGRLGGARIIKGRPFRSRLWLLC